MWGGAGTTIWGSAFFANAKGQNGPASMPTSTNLPGGASTVRAADAGPAEGPSEMRIAA